MTQLMTATAEAVKRAEVSGEAFANQLRIFVNTWKPEDPYEVQDFQMDLTRLMVAAMRTKSDWLGAGITQYAELQFSERAMQPLAAIMDKPK